MSRPPSLPNSYRGAILISLSLSLFVISTRAQPKEYQRKLSATIAARLANAEARQKTRFRITLAGQAWPDELNKPNYEAKKIRADSHYTFAVITCTKDELLNRVLPLSGIRFVEDAARVPKEELLINDLDFSVNKINLTHRWFPQFNGEETTVSVKEDLPDTTDIDLAGRFVPTDLSSSTVSSHATIMSTMICGGGNTWHLGKGAAWGSSISSSNFANLLPDSDTAYRKYNISVQNHSYGVGVESYYGSDAAAYDASAIDNPTLLHVFSAGNSGSSSPATGIYSGLTGFANLTGSFKMAKNIIAAGATDSFGIIPAASSKGPAYDGRVKPELVAYGEDGTSGSAALVSGTALLLQNAYKQLNGSSPENALIKAILINSADDIGTPEVDYASGFGALNAYHAMQTLQSNRFAKGVVASGDSLSFGIAVPPGLRKLKITLVWNDPPAPPNATKALVNDLDLELHDPLSGATWLPWVLNPSPSPDSLRAPAVRKRDSLNNIEQVTLRDPVPGNYQVKVKGFSIVSPSQPFYLAYQFDSSDVFEWQFPVAGNFIFPSALNTIRWNSSYAASMATLEFSTDNGNAWQQVSSNLDLTKGYYSWNVPSLTCTALLRMSIGSNRFVSDTFTISPRVLTGVGFDCPDSFLIYWNKIQASTDYRIFTLGRQYLEPIFTTTDSFTVMAKRTNASLEYAVAPMLGGREGVKSYTFNYTTQGVECYIRSFLASLVNDSAQLELTLGTLYNISKVVLERSSITGFLPLQQLTAPTGLAISFSDNKLTKGLNTYRIKLELNDGKTIYSQPETVYYFAGSEFIVFPNPARSNGTINYLSADLLHTTTLQVFNVLGQKIIQRVMEDITGQIPAGRLNKGLYLFRFVRNGQKDVVLKVLVL